ncbi:MAG TPA: signal peptidase I [Candidatus Methanoperedens sp.]|nr:signal peptidase I [Candidatus Methanoperedens sp.]
MLDYIIFNAIFIVSIVLLYSIRSSQNIIARLISGAIKKDRRKKISRSYLEQFREHKTGSSSLLVQMLPWFAVLAVVFILSNQYVYFGTIMTGSMEPKFKRGDLVLMQTFNKDVKVGDIIMYTSVRFIEPITHRVVKIAPDGTMTTKGDNNLDEDPWVIRKQNVMGKAVTMGGEPVVLKSLGKIFVPESSDFSIMIEIPKGMEITILFQKFRAVQPLVIIFGTIFYFFILIETRMEKTRKLKRYGGGIKNEGGN